MSDDLFIYAEGIFYASVCSALPQAEVEQRMADRYAGTTRGWRLDDEGVFASGQPNPCPCDQTPETHTHYLFTC